MNGLAGRVDVCQFAAGEVAGALNIYLSETNKGDHRLWCPQESRPSEQVQVVPLDDLVARYPSIQPPVLLKIDVQGFEFKVLSGARRVLLEPCLILAEFWPAGLAATGCELLQFEALLASRNMSIFELQSGRLKPVSSLQGLAPGFTGDNFCDLVITNMDLPEAGLADLLGWAPAHEPVSH